MITLAILKERAEQGDQFALRAYKAYKTDDELQAAIAASKAADYTDGGYHYED